MDLSPEFVEMCRQAKEIKEVWNPQIGDYVGSAYKLTKFEGLLVKSNVRDSELIDTWFILKTNNNETTLKFVDDEISPESIHYFPIYRQDQLQEMIWREGWLHIAKQCILATFCSFAQKRWDTTGIFSSMEQLWLAFVMRERFNKVWNPLITQWELGEDWVKSE